MRGEKSHRCPLIIALLALSLGLSSRSASADATPAPIVWNKLGSGLEQANFSVEDGPIISSSIAAIRSDMRNHRLAVIRASEFGWKSATVKEMCTASGATACINANFFDEQGKPLGLVMSRGILLNRIHKGGGLLTGILFASQKQVGIVRRESFSTEGVVEAVQAGPRLVSEGRIVEGLKESRSTNLSGICIDAEHRVTIYRVSSGVFGTSLRQLQSTLLAPPLNCTEALNFDGGGSSSMYLAGEISGHAGAVREENFPGVDEVPIAVGLFPLAQPTPLETPSK